MESATITAEKQDPKLQQVRICSNANAVGKEIREKTLLSFGRPQVCRGLQQETLCGKEWILAPPLHAPELPWTGPAPDLAFLLQNFSGDAIKIVSSNTHSIDLSWSKWEGGNKINRFLTFERPAWLALYFQCFFCVSLSAEITSSCNEPAAQLHVSGQCNQLPF